MSAERLEYLRARIEAEDISWGELAELQAMADEIPEGDTLLRQWAGVPEFNDDAPRVRDLIPVTVPSAETLAAHVGHEVAIVTYGNDPIWNVALECHECHMVLMDYDAPSS